MGISVRVHRLHVSVALAALRAGPWGAAGEEQGQWVALRAAAGVGGAGGSRWPRLGQAWPRHAGEPPRRDGALRGWKCSARGSWGRVSSAARLSWCFRQSRAGGSPPGARQGRSPVRLPRGGGKPTSPAAARARPGQQPDGAAKRAHLGFARFAVGSHQPGSALRRGTS